MKTNSLEKAFDHLSKDSVMNFLIHKFSNKIAWGNRFSKNNAKSIANLIIEQQIRFKAAITVKKRFSELTKNKTNSDILSIPDNEIQSLGLSHRKVEYIKNTFQFFKNNDVEFNKLTDDEVIKELTKIKGVGEWTAQMFLIFNLFRKDIFSPKELALINSIKINYKINNLENSRLNELTNTWSPYNSIACLLLWESIENKVFFKT